MLECWNIPIPSYYGLQRLIHILGQDVGRKSGPSILEVQMSQGRNVQMLDCQDETFG
jgi:hypothetical protein